MELNLNLRMIWENWNSPNRKRIVACSGATRSGKTWSIIEFLINIAATQPNLVISVVRKDAATHNESTLRDWKSIMLSKYLPAYNRGKYNGSLKTFTFENGSIIEFIAANDLAKVHGGARDILFIDEFMECNRSIWLQLAARTRHQIYIAFNPSLQRHFFWDQIYPLKDDLLFIHSTYLDNPHLTDTQVQQIESTDPSNPINVKNNTADQFYWDCYGCGKRAKREGVIYENYTTASEAEWPEAYACQKHMLSLDFGFASDPCACIDVRLFNRRLYLKEVFYETGLLTCKPFQNPNVPSIEGRLERRGVRKDQQIVADSASPVQIAELSAAGYWVTGVKKGPDSIVAGINMVKRFPLVVHEDSQNIEFELNNYCWDQPRGGGDFVPKPRDADNHACDAFRYAVMEHLPEMAVTGSNSPTGRIARTLAQF